MSALMRYILMKDISLFFLFNQRLHSNLLYIFMRWVTEMGSPIFAVGLTLYFLILSKNQSHLTGIKMAAILIFSQMVVQLTKRIVNRPRPYQALENVCDSKTTRCVYSFPSGHTCAAFSMAFVLADSFPFLSISFLGLAGLVGISRIYLGAHYPTDVLAGIVIAYASLAAEKFLFFSSLF